MRVMLYITNVILTENYRNIGGKSFILGFTGIFTTYCNRIRFKFLPFSLNRTLCYISLALFVLLLLSTSLVALLSSMQTKLNDIRSGGKIRIHEASLAKIF